MELLTTKTKVLAFQGKSPLETKTVLKGKQTEQVNILKYVTCNININHLNDFNKNVRNFQYQYECTQLRERYGAEQ
jgi:hypothetical protein